MVRQSEKAHVVARQLVNTWKITSVLAEQQGIEFFAILQPTAFTNVGASLNPNLGLTEGLNFALSKQFVAVYPLIKQYAKDANINFIDLSFALDTCSDCYFDFCHLRPSGNAKIARSMVDIFKTF
jgi:hypothetical protein